MKIDTKSMQGFVTYMQGRAVGSNARFHVEEKTGSVVMDLCEDNGLSISIAFIDEEKVIFMYETEDAYLTKEINSIGGFISAMIEFTQKPASHFTEIIEHIDENPITYKPYVIYYKTVETMGDNLLKYAKEGV